MVREPVKALVKSGRMPSSEAREEDIDEYGKALDRIERPVTSEEATELLDCFGPDECFGLAWTLIHTIETAPEVRFREQPASDTNEWIRLLWERAQ